MKRKRNRNGFTLMEMLIVIALIAVLIAIAIPVFASQLEKSREATDLANVRAAYAQVSTEAQLGNFEATVTVDLKQKKADWQSVDPVNIGGIVHYTCTLQSALTASPISSASSSSMQCAYWSCGIGNGMVATPYSG